MLTNDQIDWILHVHGDMACLIPSDQPISGGSNIMLAELCAQAREANSLRSELAALRPVVEAAKGGKT